LKEKGFDIDRKNISIKGELIKEIGSYTATVKLHREVSVEIPFEIVSE
jgi:large subunit ribosomal protein L9